ncbi:MAG: methionine--tRNA ligase, partial [Leptospirales bacterium]
MTDKHFYITTPIYYANDRPHIGHAYTTTLADVLVRYHRLLGYDTFFLTGTDEHGQKVQQAAAARGVTPQAQVDEYHQRFKELWQKLNITYDRFIRTTDPDHIAFVQQSLQELFDKGEIYEEVYAGWYSVGEERFLTDDELVDGKDPVSGKAVEWIEEKNYFFKMSKYQQALVQYIEDHPDFILPDFRKNEVLGFLRQPLHDLCISRPKSRLEWGIPLPFDENFVTYVWFDALLNYQSGVRGKRYPDGGDPWPADFHLIGKDILTTHAVYWPTMLMGMGRKLPKHILAHGWWLTPKPTADASEAPENDAGEKMSKSKGNVVDPLAYAEEYGVDVVRYFLMRDMVLGQDATFSHELFVNRVNTDLANDLGNAINRVNKFVLSKFEGVLPAPVAPDGDLIAYARARPDADLALESELQTAALATIENTAKLLSKEMKLSFALEEVAVLVRKVNRYLEQRAPWKLAKLEAGPENPLPTVLYTTAETLRVALSLLSPVMPEKTKAGLAMLGVQKDASHSDLAWGVLKGGETFAAQAALFPRIETRNESAQQKQKGAQPGQIAGQKKTKTQQSAAPVDPAAKLEFRVAKIAEVADHPDADGLYV